MKPEQIAKTRAQAIACAQAVNKCRLLFLKIGHNATESSERRAYDLELAFWRLAERYERERKP